MVKRSALDRFVDICVNLVMLSITVAFAVFVLWLVFFTDNWMR